MARIHSSSGPPSSQNAGEFRGTVRRACEAGALTRWEGWRLVRRYRRARLLVVAGNIDRAFGLYCKLNRRLHHLLAANSSATPWAGILLEEIHWAMRSLLKQKGFGAEAEGIDEVRQVIRDLVGLGKLDGPSGSVLEEKLHLYARELLRNRPQLAAAAAGDFVRVVRRLGDSGRLGAAEAAALRDGASKLGEAVSQRLPT